MRKQWSSSSKTAKLSAPDKEKFLAIVRQHVSSSSRLSQVVNRYEVKAGRIYLYRLHEQFGWDNPDTQFIKPLIDGKYAEFPMARIALFDALGEKCEADYQRHTGQWVHLFSGDITSCLDFIEQNDQWFQ